MAVQLNKRLLTVEEYHKMGEAGILQEQGLELINGEIIKRSPIGSKHVSCVNKLNALLNALLGKKAIVSVQNPVIIGGLSEPEPDIAILVYREDYYAEEIPSAKDVLLIIEVADTSLAYNREVKLPQYAESGVPEFWLVNLTENVIEVHWQPMGNDYKFRELLRTEDVIRAKNFDLAIPVEKVLI
ncbi:MAG: Uma2 family endonuclease [Phaeodactylibacter sp.]|nr:Uma2 family endonuclease [Phaeodactylibacter sp.]